MQLAWNKTLLRFAAALLWFLSLAGLAQAGPVMQSGRYAYMTAGDEPWLDGGNLAAMDAAFGGNWSRLQFGDAIGGYDLLYIDGGYQNGGDMLAYLGSHRSALEGYVRAGGRLFINAATELMTGAEERFDLVFGARSVEWKFDARSFEGHALDPLSVLFDGAGEQWSGSYFAHNGIIASSGFNTLIADEQGRVVLSGGFFGEGYAMLGGQTNTAFHGSLGGSDPFQLRVNELLYALNVRRGFDVPEPAMPGILMAAFASMLVVVRRRR